MYNETLRNRQTGFNDCELQLKAFSSSIDVAKTFVTQNIIQIIYTAQKRITKFSIQMSKKETK